MSSRLVPGLYPAPNQNAAADAIYARRGAAGRGLSPLDANLLHAPSDIVLGYNALLDAVRNKGRLVGYIREAIILRIAALNGAAYEWIHHVELGRKEGLSTGQLYVIRDTDTPLVLPGSKVMGGLLTAVLRFTDESTRGARVSMEVCERLKEEIGKSLSEGDGEGGDVDGVYVEVVMVVGTYNMVSRFLLSTDVGGMMDGEVPWPVEREERFVSVPSFPPLKEPRHEIHCVTLRTSDSSAPWLVFANGLNTDWRMWSLVIPRMLDRGFNMVLHSQRGHGLSTLPPMEGEERLLTSIPLQAMDIGYILEELEIPMPVCSVIGVSQGGATTIGFAGMYGESRTRSVVVCDTAGATPVGNKEAWEERMRVVCGSSGMDMEEYAKKVGMGKLAKMTVERWFPIGSSCHPGSGVDGRVEWMEEMIKRTKVEGFYEGAKALGSYSVDGGSSVEKVLLVAGSLDGGGKVGKGMRSLKGSYVEIEGSGHLPMIDCPDVFCDRVLCFLFPGNG